MVDFVVLMPLGPTLIKDLEITPVEFGSLVSSYNYTAAFFGLLFGSFADKFDRKPLLLLSLCGFILGTFSCALGNSFELLLISRMFTGAFGGMMNGLIFAVISDVVPFERRGKAMGVVMSAFSVASVIGVPIGLAISDLSRWQNTFHFIGLFSLFILLATQLIFPNITQHIGVQRDSFQKRVIKLLKNRDYLTSFIFISIVSGSIFLLIPYLSPFAVNNMGIETEQLKYMYLTGGIFTVITARIAGVLTDKIGALKLFTIMVFISFLAVLLYTHSSKISFIHYLVLGTFFMTMVSGRMIPCMTLISEVPSLDDRGFFMSVMHSFRAVGSATMTLVGGLFITEMPNGKLIGFDHAGYFSIVMGVITVAMASLIGSIIKKKPSVTSI